MAAGERLPQLQVAEAGGRRVRDDPEGDEGVGALLGQDERLVQGRGERRHRLDEVVGGQHRHDRVGVGGRMDTLQCAVVLAKLPRFEWELQRRAAMADGEIAHLVVLAARGTRLQALLQWAWRHVVDEEKRPRAELHAGGADAVRRAEGAGLLAVVGAGQRRHRGDGNNC